MSITLAVPARYVLEVKRSRFVCQAASIDSAEAALLHLQQVADPDATHNCWAYRIGSAYRSSDDGEPAGTAGRPILAAIDGQGLDGVVAVVTRWYGGIKLGAGGLVRAYGGCAAECLRTAERLTVEATYASAQATYRFPTRRAEPQLQIGAQPSIGSKLSMSRLRVVGS
ncbi:IMPACT family protein, partial [Aquimonas sp.]|uniref:IMPACT family protein n=1 Tax=Aquimonas sp. TaxID=1872588 RepID=UPI0037C06420